MSNLLHVCLYNVDQAASKELTQAIGGLNFVRLVAETDHPEELATELKHTKKATIRSATGNVTVRLGTFASFQLEATSTNGAVKGSGVNVEVDQFEKNTAKLARGNGGAILSVESQSGQIVIRPL